ncbi:MAG: hypothetical protein BWY30_01152 [Tenericutes bacterium ADurb.Bin239]|nr:MAG: hypothetical protein BWY30_01152 [Tenericutes bacterium ADurb.Bin239]
MFNYTISIIENNRIERLYYNTEKDANKIYSIMCGLARYAHNIEGVLLWQHQKGKTIDTDPLARILKQYYK